MEDRLVEAMNILRAGALHRTKKRQYYVDLFLGFKLYICTLFTLLINVSSLDQNTVAAMSQTQESQPLRIIIVGAGIGGLTTALALRYEGHHVQIFEKSKFANEVGAAIALPANIYGILKRLGVNTEEHGSNTEDIRSFYTMKGDLVFEEDFTHMGGAARLIHRVDLHEALKEAAIAQGVTISLDSAVESVDPEAGSVTLKGGQNFSADVIIGADGVHSVLRNSVVPDAPEPEPFHISMFRMLIPCSKLAERSETTRFIDPPGKMTIFSSQDGRRTVNYPCRSNTVMNVAALFPADFARSYENETDMKNHMMDIFSDFHPSPIALISAADEVGVWTLYDLPPLSAWYRGHTAIMGDAAHPLLPYAAQGAAQAMEDAATLAVVLRRGTTLADVAQRLKLYFDIRQERAYWVQDFARSSDQSTPKNPGVKPKIDPAKFFEEVYDHDAWTYAEERLRKYLETRL
jgi:2-polyprenyl-6-methoxyphenol hydroxylase-like FAD-dependent oxidoreductase